MKTVISTLESRACLPLKNSQETGFGDVWFDFIEGAEKGATLFPDEHRAGTLLRLDNVLSNKSCNRISHFSIRSAGILASSCSL